MNTQHFWHSPEIHPIWDSLTKKMHNIFFNLYFFESMTEGLGVTRPAARRQPERLFGQAATPRPSAPTFPFLDPSGLFSFLSILAFVLCLF